MTENTHSRKNVNLVNLLDLKNSLVNPERTSCERRENLILSRPLMDQKRFIPLFDIIRQAQIVLNPNHDSLIIALIQKKSLPQSVYVVLILWSKILKICF